MHLFAKLLLEDLENCRNELIASFEKLTPEQWQRKIPGREKDIRELGEHILSDAKRLAILAPIVGIHDVFPKPSDDDRYACVWENQKRPFSPENIFEKSKYERSKLRTLLGFIRDSKKAKQLYESSFQTGWHERMHMFDLKQALRADHQHIAIPQGAKMTIEWFIEQLGVIVFLYDMDVVKIDEIAQTNQTYSQEIKMLTQGKFVDAIHRWLGISDHIPRLKGNAEIIQQVHHIHALRNDIIEHIGSLYSEQLTTIIDGKPLVKRLQRLSLDFQAKMLLFKKINLRDSWAREARL